MTLVVVGEGAEGVFGALGRAVVALSQAGVDVVGLDPIAARDSVLTGEPADVLNWMLTQFSPEVVVVVDGDRWWSEVGARAPRGSVVVQTGEEDFLRAVDLRVLGRPQPLGDGEEKAVATLHRVLGEVWPASAEAVVVTERTPRVSILVAFYNLEHFTHEVMRSTLTQTYDDFEVVALDDGSTDRTARILDSYRGNPRVRVVTQANVGGTGRMDLVCNELVRAARGELLAFQGGDDVSLPERLSTQVEAFDADPALGVCHSAAFIEDAATRRAHLGFRPGRAYDEWSLLRELMRENAVGHPSVMMRRSTWERHGFFEEGLSADLHFWLKAAPTERFRYLPQALVRYRVHERSLSTSSDGLTRTSREGLRLRLQALDRSPLEVFFPELRDTRDHTIRGEAWTALGNGVVRTFPELAIAAYARGIDEGSAEAQYNTAIAYALMGAEADAAEAAHRAARMDACAAELLHVLNGRDADSGTVALRVPLSHLEPALRRSRRADGSDVRRWDGSAVSVRTAYVGLAADRPDLAVAGLRAWGARTRADDRLRWVIPTLGAELAGLLGLFLRAAEGIELGDSAEIALEHVDAMMLLPPVHDQDEMPAPLSEGRTHGVLGDAVALRAFSSWIRERPGSAGADDERSRPGQAGTNEAASRGA